MSVIPASLVHPEIRLGPIIIHSHMSQSHLLGKKLLPLYITGEQSSNCVTSFQRSRRRDCRSTNSQKQEWIALVVRDIFLAITASLQ